MSPDAQAIVEAIAKLTTILDWGFLELAIIMTGCTIAICRNLRGRR